MATLKELLQANQPDAEDKMNDVAQVSALGASALMAKKKLPTDDLRGYNNAKLKELLNQYQGNRGSYGSPEIETDEQTILDQLGDNENSKRAQARVEKMAKDMHSNVKMTPLSDAAEPTGKVDTSFDFGENASPATKDLISSFESPKDMGPQFSPLNKEAPASAKPLMIPEKPGMPEVAQSKELALRPDSSLATKNPVEQNIAEQTSGKSGTPAIRSLKPEVMGEGSSSPKMASPDIS